IDPHARYVGQLRSEPLDDVVCKLATLASRLQMDHELSEIGTAKRLRRASADGRDEPLDVRIGTDDVGNRPLIFHELLVRRSLCGFSRDGDLIRVLVWNETLRHHHE